MAPQGTLNADAIGKARGHRVETVKGTVRLTVGREGGMMHQVKFGGSMGLATWAAFNGSDEAAAVVGDFVTTGPEVQPVLRALRKADIHIVSLHNHMIGEQPSYYFVHFWGKGPAKHLAEGVRAAFDAQAKAGMAAAKH